MSEFRRVSVEYLLSEEDVKLIEEVRELFEKQGVKDYSFEEYFELLVMSGWRSKLKNNVELHKRILGKS